MEHEDLQEIKTTLQRLGQKVEKVYSALVGNDITQDGGLVEDVRDQRKEIQMLQGRITTLETSDHRKKIYLNIIWLAAGFIVASIVSHFLK